MCWRGGGGNRLAKGGGSNRLSGLVTKQQAVEFPQVLTSNIGVGTGGGGGGLGGPAPPPVLELSKVF